MPPNPPPSSSGKSLPIAKILQLPGAKSVLTAFFCYCALEATAGLWAASYMVFFQGMDKVMAARFASFFYIGITAGRFLGGFVSDRLGDRTMVRIGEGIIAIGILFLFIPSDYTIPAGLILTGLGCAPIYPSLLHATPTHFGAYHATSIMGVQMACAYIGATFMPPLFGLVAEHIQIAFFPLALLLFWVAMLLGTEKINRITAPAS